jgi:hypothetical protein
MTTEPLELDALHAGENGMGVAKGLSVSDKRLELRRLIATTAVVSLLTLSGCASTAYVGAEVPVNVEHYPSTYYDGRVVYWTGDRWYTYRNGVRVYYHSEPYYLRQYRGHWRGDYYRPAPRYYRRHYDHRRYHQNPRYRREAPPARSVAPRAPRR